MWRTDPRVQNPIESSSHTSPVVLVKRLVADGSITAGAISVLNDSVRPTCPAIQSILRLRAYHLAGNSLGFRVRVLIVEDEHPGGERSGAGSVFRVRVRVPLHS